MPTYSGHAPGHVRDTFLSAIDAYYDWKAGEPEPNVEFEVQYEPTSITISQACGLVWNCTDILPGIYFDMLHGDCDLPLRRRTFGSAARAMLDSIKTHTVQAA